MYRNNGCPRFFYIHKNNLAWHPLERSNKGEDHFALGGIFGDLVFHLGSVNRDIITMPGDDERGDKFRVSRTLRRMVAPLFSHRMKRLLLKNIMPHFGMDLFFPAHHANREAFAAIRSLLLSDPDAYIHYLRTGRHSVIRDDEVR
jgi:hypothetical protein